MWEEMTSDSVTGKGKRAFFKGIVLVSPAHPQQPETPTLLSSGNIQLISQEAQSQGLKHVGRATKPLSLDPETCPSLAGRGNHLAQWWV